MKKYKAPAKINLYLEVIGKREDGFHELLMLMEEIPLYDFLYIEKDYGISLDCDIIKGDDNLVFQAAQLYLDHFGIDRGARIKLEKNIPLGAGLGGGSSDAATTLKALRDLYGKGSDEDLLDLAARLGSDVPFFLKKGPCIAKGRGEILEELVPRDLGWILLVKPDYGLSTAQVFKSLELKTSKDKGEEDFQAFMEAYSSGGDFMSLSKNDLEDPSFKLAPQLEELKNIMGPGALMSGSGTTLFKICQSKDQAEEIEARLPEDLWVRLIRG